MKINDCNDFIQRYTHCYMKSLHAKHAKSIPITLEKMSDLPMDLAWFAWKHKFHINFFFLHISKNIFEVEIHVGDLDAHGRDLLKSIKTCKMMKSGFSSFCMQALHILTPIICLTCFFSHFQFPVLFLILNFLECNFNCQGHSTIGNLLGINAGILTSCTRIWKGLE